MSTTTSSPKSTRRTSSDDLMVIDHVNKVFAARGKAESAQALKDVTCTIQKGAMNIITGPSGSGKSTLLDTILGLQPPTSGKVLVSGEDIYSLSSDDRAFYRARMLGMVYQANYWVRSLNVLENVALPLYLSGYTRAQSKLLAEMSLESVGMTEFASYMPTYLSGGQQQRVSMARALVANPEVVVADEPTGNLDTRNGSLIMDLLVDCVKAQNKTVVLVTHNLEYLPLADKILYIKDGQLSENMTVAQVMASLGPVLKAGAKS